MNGEWGEMVDDRDRRGSRRDKKRGPRTRAAVENQESYTRDERTSLDLLVDNVVEDVDIRE